MKSFVVVGLGNFGASAAMELAGLGCEVLAVDSDEAKVQRVAPFIRRVVCGDGTDRTVLEELGVGRVSAGIVSTGADVTASALTATGLRDCGVAEIYVKVISELHARILRRIGVSETIFPERESARLLVRRAVDRTVLNYVELGAGLSAQEMAVPAGWVGKTLRELELPRRFGVTVVALRDWLNGTTITAPDPDKPLTDADALLVAGHDRDLSKLAASA
ncbi:MAG: TrkA family potassium uptake protein [Thermoanaerobaculia bacterium]